MNKITWVFICIISINICFSYSISDVYTLVNPTYTTNDTCVEDWVQSYSLCTNETEVLYYTDINNCNTTIDLPIDNSTLKSCNTKPNEKLILLIVGFIGIFVFLAILLILCFG